MYIHRDQADRLVEASLATIRARIQDHLALIKELLEGDDWSFVIKTQALIEACVTEAILVKLRDARIKKTVESMPLVGAEVSKVQIAKELDLLDATHRRFIIRMAALRNRLAHRVEFIHFKFPQYIETLNRDARKDWQESIVWYSHDPASRAQWREVALSQPRSAILMGAFLIAANLALEDNQSKLMHAIDAASVKTTDELLSYLRRPE